MQIILSNLRAWRRSFKTPSDRALIRREFFYFFSLLFCLAVILEIIWPNIIIAYFNLNLLLIVWLLSALLHLIRK